MTRQGKNATMWGQLGSFSRNFKRLAVLSALLFSSQMGEAQAEESQYKVRIHKNFIKDVLDKNFPIILQHLHSIQADNKYLAEVNANIEKLSLRIEPKEGSFENVKSELFFDQGQIVMELSDLKFVGHGMLTDPETSVQDFIKINAELDLVQMVMSLDQELTSEGNLYPKVEITDVALTMHKDTFQIESKGDIPLYKTHQFEEGLKKWFISQLTVREAEFKKEMQTAEREIMSSFAFKKDIQFSKKVGDAMGKSTAHSSLSETMTLTSDHIIVNYMTEYEGRDLQKISKSMRRIKPQFSEEPEHQRDVQIVLDENYINYYLFSLFYADKPISLSEVIIGFIPDTFGAAGSAVKAIMNTKIFSVFFPQLEKFKNRRVDLKCALNKEFLNRGHLEDQSVSHIKFKDGNQVDVDLHFGCQIMVYDKDGSDNEMEQLMEMFMAMNTQDEDSSKWIVFREFFTSMSASWKFDTAEHAKRQHIPFQDQMNAVLGDKVHAPKMSEHIPLIWGRILDFEPKVHELKVFHEGDEIKSEARQLNDKIMSLRENEIYENPILKPVFEFVFGHSIPIAPFPTVERCLGLNAKDSEMKIVEGYAVMSYDFKTQQSNSDCLFNMRDTIAKKELRMAEFEAKRTNTPMHKFEKQMMDMAKQALGGAGKGMPPLDLPKMMNDPMVKGVMNFAKDEKVQKMAKDLIGGANPMMKEMEKMAKKFGGAKGAKNPLEMLFQK